MKKRIACLVLAMVMFIGLIPAGIFTTQASAADMTISDAGLSAIKSYVGFHGEAYEVGTGVYRIGYGTPSVKDATITEKNAGIQLKQFLEQYDQKINDFLTINSVKVTQAQYDALVWYSFHQKSTGWTVNADIANAIKRINVPLEFSSSGLADAFANWQLDSNSLKDDTFQHTIRNRMIIANQFVYSTYSGSSTGSFAYTLFDTGEDGKFSDNTTMKIQVFDTKDPVAIKVADPSPIVSGNLFQGWYTPGEKLVTGLSSSLSGVTLKAGYTEVNKEISVYYRLPGSAVYDSYKKQDSSFDSTKTIYIYKTADETDAKIDVILRDQVVTVVAEKYVGSVKWVRLESGGWLKLGNWKTIPNVTMNMDVTITDDYVNIREAADVKAAQVGVAKRGEKVTIFSTYQDSAKRLWGYTAKGWLCLLYTDYAERLIDNKETPTAEKVIATGTVSCSSAVNVRESATAASAQRGTIADGVRVQIFEITTTIGHQWGRTASGWICLDYVNLDNTSSSSSGSSVANGVKGVVVNAPEVNVRVAAGAGNKLATVLKEGTSVTVYEQKVVDGANWGRIDEGWIALDYVNMSAAVGPTTIAVTKGVVKSNGNLVVRIAAGSEYQKIGTLAPGTTVSIKARQTVQGVLWGQLNSAEGGWINLNYVDFAPKSTTSGIAGTIVNCSTSVNVRSDAGTTNALVGTIALGNRVVIQERKLVAGHYWGRTDKGWVCLDYVQLEKEWVDPTPEKAEEEEIVVTVFKGYPATLKTGETAPVYAEASTEAKIVLTLKNGASVNIQQFKNVKNTTFAKVVVGTNIGWVDFSKFATGKLYVKVSVAKADTYEEASSRSSFYASVNKDTNLVVEADSLVFDGSVLWGCVKVGTHDAYIKMTDVTMYVDNHDNMAVDYINITNGKGYLTGTLKSDAGVDEDMNGEPGSPTGITLVAGRKVTIQTRVFIKATNSTWGKVLVGNTTGWINMDKVQLDEVEMTVTDNSMEAFQSDYLTEAKALEKGDRIHILERTVRAITYKPFYNDWAKVYVNDDPKDVRYVILDEGRLTYSSKAPTLDTNTADVTETISVVGKTKAAVTVYEEAMNSADNKAVLKLSANTYVTVLNWKEVDGMTWGKVQYGSTVGWVKVSELSFTDLTGIVAVDQLKIYVKTDLNSANEIYRVNGREFSVVDNSVKLVNGVLWAEINVAGKTGFVNLANVKLNNPSADPVVSRDAIATATVNSVNVNAMLLKDDCVTESVVSVPKNTKVSLMDVKIVGAETFWKVNMGDKSKDGWLNMKALTINPLIAKLSASKAPVLEELTAASDVIDYLYEFEKATVTKLVCTNSVNAVYNLYGEIAIDDTTGWIMLCSNGGEKPFSMAPGAVPNSSSTTPTTPSTPSTPAAPTGTTATIVCNDTVNVRAGAGVGYNVVTKVSNGTVVTIYEQAAASNGVMWGKISATLDQWVCMDYVKSGIGSGTTNSGVTSGTITNPVILTTVPSGAVAVGFADSNLDVYGGPGFGYGKAGSIPKNSAVVIYERKLDAGVSWARTDNGWIFLTSVTLTGIGSGGSKGTIANTYATAKVRTSAGANGTEIGKVLVSSSISYDDTTVVSGENWCHTALGWICMNYVMTQTIPAPEIAPAPDSTPVVPESGEVG